MTSCVPTYYQGPKDIDGVAAFVNSRPGPRAPEGTVAIVGAGRGAFYVHESFIDRETVVHLIEALTNAVAAYDDSKKAKQERRIKRGDKLIGRVTGHTFTAITDERAGGNFSAVNTTTGVIKDSAHSAGYRHDE